MTRYTTRTVRYLALAGLVALGGCSEVLTLDVEAPGRIADDDLNNADAIPGLAAGAAYNLTDGFDISLQEFALGAGNLWHSGSYDFGAVPRGLLQQEPEDWDGEYGQMQQARWVAEDGLRRMATILEPTAFDSNPDVARTYLTAGFANRLLGEVQCSSTIDGGPEVPNTEHFNRADSLFNRAITVAGNAGRDDLVRAGYGGLASIRAWLDDWSGAVSAANQAIGDGLDWSYDYVFSSTSGAIENDLVFETNSRREFTVLNTLWEDNDPDDPRVTWEIVLDNAGQVEKGQDGETDFYRQLKYLTQDDDVPLTKGTEMLMLLAENALRDGDIPGMIGFLDDARDFYGLPNVGEPDAPAVPATDAEAWELLRVERSATLWLEGRRLWDLRRWEAEGGVVADPYSADRDTCFPISDEERRVNENLSG